MLAAPPTLHPPQVLEVCDWLEIIGLGQYRRRFVHHAVSGSLLLALGPEELKVGAGLVWVRKQRCVR